MNFMKKLFGDPGRNFSLSNMFLFSQIPNPYVAVPAVGLALYIFLRSLASEKTPNFFEFIERPLGKLLLATHRRIPFLNKIPVEEFDRDKDGSTLLAVGAAQVHDAARRAAKRGRQPEVHNTCSKR